MQALGVANALDSASGFTAGSKGNTALSGALAMLYERAAELGGNAVLGLVTSTFGADGGITNALGGDAVRVLLLGTAVVVEPLPTERVRHSRLGLQAANRSVAPALLQPLMANVRDKRLVSTSKQLRGGNGTRSAFAWRLPGADLIVTAGV